MQGRHLLPGLGQGGAQLLVGPAATDTVDVDRADRNQRRVAKPEPVEARKRNGGDQRKRQHAPATDGSGAAPAAATAGQGDLGCTHSPAPFKPAGRRTSPRTCTSGSSSTPKRCLTRRRPSAISSSTSAVVASPVFSTKLACFSAKPAPPRPIPRQPAASSSWPAVIPCARSSSGFLKVEPKVLMPEGCAPRRCSRIPARVALIASGSPGSSAKLARATTSSGPRLELR